MKHKKQRTPSEMFPLIKDWIASQDDKRQFCRKHQLSLSTFNYWFAKYSALDASSVESAFIRLENPAARPLDHAYTLVYPNGVQLQIHIQLSPEALFKLIRLAQP